MLLSIPVFMLGMAKMGASGVALGVSVSAFMQVILLYVCWNRRTWNKESGHVYVAVMKMMLLSIFLGSALEAIRQWIFEGSFTDTFSGALLTCLGLGTLFLCLLYGACRIMKMNDLLDILEKPIQKMAKRFYRNKEQNR